MQPSKRFALLIVDMQVGLFRGPEQPFEGERVLAHINALIDMARVAHAPVFAVRHMGPQGSPIAPGSALAQLLPELKIDAAVDVVFDKTRPSCFLGTDLADQLRRAGVAGIVIAGMKTQYCIDTTCRAAVEHGFQVVLVADAHTCMDTPDLPASTIIAHHNRTLSGPIATLRVTSDVLF
ncbi:MAG: cysteine hydrolase [Burkholderiales bacterium]|nr:cysteine hydrolase [Burkholderiales bacterium]